MRTNHLAVCCLTDLFETGDEDLGPASLNIATIRAWYGGYVAANVPEVRRFKFCARDDNGVDRTFFVIDDAALRYAYRLWLSLEDRILSVLMALRLHNSPKIVMTKASPTLPPATNGRITLTSKLKIPRSAREAMARARMEIGRSALPTRSRTSPASA